MNGLSRGDMFDLARTLLWLASVPVAYGLGWLDSVAFVSVLSAWALVETAWAAYRAGRSGSDDALQRIEEKLDRLLEREVG